MICIACNEDVSPVIEMTGHGTATVSRCPRHECGAQWPPEVPASRPAPKLRSATAPLAVAHVEDGDSGQTAVAILASARTRLLWVRERLAELDALRAEAATLERMIAAESGPVRRGGSR